MVLMLVALPVLAESPGAAPNPSTVFFSVAPASGSGACAPPAAVETGEIGAFSVCTAWCQDGSTRTCSGISCFAVDASCPSERGYCWGSSTGTISCPACTSGGCTCQQGAQCSSDSDCDCNLGYGFCDKEPWEIVGACSCYF